MITLKTLPQATAQEVFDQVVNHLAQQRRASRLINESTCAYRGMYGLMCAAGCLVADDEIQMVIERQSWLQLVGDGRVPAAHKCLISDLQGIHDQYVPKNIKLRTLWLRDLRNMAAEYGLDPAAVDAMEASWPEGE